MNSKIMMTLLAFLLILPCALILGACGENKTQKYYDITFNVDASKISGSYYISSNSTINTKEIGKTEAIFGYDIYDYSQMQVLVDGQIDTTIFTNEFQKNDKIYGNKIQIGQINFDKITKNCTISFTGIKEREIKIGFVASDDSRLGIYKDDITGEQKELFESNKNLFSNNFKIKMSQSDAQYFKDNEDNYSQLGAFTQDNAGYVDAKWVFNDSNEILYTINNPEYSQDNSQPETLNVYKPYMFTFYASELAKPTISVSYIYVEKSTNSTHYTNQKWQYIPDGTIEYEIKEYDYSLIFPMLCKQYYGAYDLSYFATIDEYENVNNENETISYEGRYLGKLDGYYIPNSLVGEQQKQCYNLTNVVYDEVNVITFDFTKLKLIDEINANINNITSSIEIDNEINSYLFTKPINTERTFKIYDLLNVVGQKYINDINTCFANAKVLINGTELTGELGSYEFVPEEKQGDVVVKDAYFQCVINPYILPINFYTYEQLKNVDNFGINFDYNITIADIDFSNVDNFSQFKASTTIEGVVSEVNWGNDFNVWQFEENNVINTYFYNQSYEYGEEIKEPKINVNFYNVQYIADSDLNLSIKEDNVAIKNINLIEYMKNSENGAVLETYDDGGWLYAYVTFNVQNYNIKMFLNVSSGENGYTYNDDIATMTLSDFQNVQISKSILQNETAKSVYEINLS